MSILKQQEESGAEKKLQLSYNVTFLTILGQQNWIKQIKKIIFSIIINKF